MSYASSTSGHGDVESEDDAQEISVKRSIVARISGDEDFAEMGGLGAMSAVKAQARLFALQSARQIVIVRSFRSVPPTAIQRSSIFRRGARRDSRVEVSM